MQAVDLGHGHREDAGEQAGRLDLVSQLGQVHPGCQMSGHRRKDVTTVEGRTGGRKVPGRVGQRNGPVGAPHHGHRRSQQAVVWAH